MFEENRKIAQEFGNRWGEAFSLHPLSQMMYHQGQIPEALAYLDEYMEFDRDLGFNESSHYLASIALWQGNLVDAQAGFEEVKKLLPENDFWNRALVEEGLGRIRYYQGDFTGAERTLQKAEMMTNHSISPFFSKYHLR
jgi:tetratricopeptide (TPR) repeat protein